MNADKTKALYEKYPKIFRQKDLSKQETAMCWGFSCGNGWYNIIDCLCDSIQQYIDHNQESWDRYKDLEEKPKWLKEPVPQIEAVQVKEKFGGLRFYVTGTDEYVRGLINMAESLSYHTCEECGNKGEPNKTGWIHTLCEPCREEMHANRAKMVQDSKQLKLFKED